MRGHGTKWTIGALSLLLLAPAAAAGQQADAPAGDGERHVVEREEAWRAMAAKADRAAEQRVLVRSVLDRPEVERVAAAHGYDLTRARETVATLDGGELSRVAEKARRVDAALAGGADTVVISTTTIIIGLLVLILILVA